MSFIFQRLSRRSSSKKGRSVSLPLPTATTHNVINNNDNDCDNAYEQRIDELGRLLSEQGRCLDELTTSNRRISDENAQLRGRLATQHSAPSMSNSTRTPLKNILNNHKSDESKLVSKLKEENKLLNQQSELLAAELRDANLSLSNRDETVSTLGKELSSCLETARKLLSEKRTRDIDLFQKTKELELANTNLKRATDQQSDTAQRLESCLLERTQLNEEVSDLSTQLTTLSSKVDKQANEIEPKKKELEKAAKKSCEADLAVKTGKFVLLSCDFVVYTLCTLHVLTRVTCIPLSSS